MLAICCASKKRWAKEHGVDPAKNQGTFVFSKNLIWDYETGELSLFCDFPPGGTLSIDDRFNSLKDENLYDKMELDKCRDVSLTEIDCY